MIAFPFVPLYTFHQLGGKITRVDGCAHETYRKFRGRSQDMWYFNGRVEWNDGKVSDPIRIMPFHLCADTDKPLAHAEISGLLDAMNAHLLAHGTWHTPTARDKRDGWLATDRTHERRI